MLVLSRKQGQKIVAGVVVVEVLGIEGGKVKLGITAPEHVRISRPEAKQQSPRKQEAA